jgi:hypothetical protein
MKLWLNEENNKIRRGIKGDIRETNTKESKSINAQERESEMRSGYDECK